MKIFEMYKTTKIDDDGFYDNMHPINNGSQQIAEYIAESIYPIVKSK